MVRALVRSYHDARLTGYLEWPVIDAMPPGLPYENRGLVTADQPWSGHYRVNAMPQAQDSTLSITPWAAYAGAARSLRPGGYRRSAVQSRLTDVTTVMYCGPHGMIMDRPEYPARLAAPSCGWPQGSCRVWTVRGAHLPRSASQE